MKLLLIFLYFPLCKCFFDIQEIVENVLRRLPEDFSLAIKDIAQGIPTKTVNIVAGNSTNISSTDIFELLCTLSDFNVQNVYLNVKNQEHKEQYYSLLKKALDISEERTSLIICEPYECEEILQELTDYNLIHRSILYMFYWPAGDVSETFLSTMKEAMKIAVITNPRHRVIYYNQATPNKLNHLSLVNWWAGKLYKLPLLPATDNVYQDFKGRVFDVPVLHAPPWHFVEYSNNSTSLNVTGGRDDKLLKLIADKLNFRFKYYDPPVRSQGSSISGNGTFKGTLGLIWKRKADFFIGDVTMTWERLQAVEFSFLTLADSGAFLTHAPAKLSETLAVLRPFRWEVWPMLCTTVLLSGFSLWLVIAAPMIWQKHGKGSMLSILNNCCWFITTLFLRQSSSKEPSNTNKARLISVLVSLGATYVIGDMYSANLTSLMAKPSREQPIGTLEALEEAMRDKGYDLVVERHSSSLTILQNGTGVYGRLAKLMKRQQVQRVRSVEVGVRLVLARRKVAVLGGRETLYYDTERFGSHNFHMSEKLYTRYSAIALQIGCPYLETFNNVVITLFEAGILSKMTTDEYKNLPEHSRRSDPVTESDGDGSDVAGETSNSQVSPETSKGLEPVSLRMLRGAFCLLGIGYLLAIIVLFMEIQWHRHCKLKILKAPRRIKSPGVVAVARATMVVKRAMRRAKKVVAVNLDKAFGPSV